MTYEEFLSITKRFEGQTLETVTGRRFKVGMSPVEDCPFYTPDSSGYSQTDGKAAAIRFVEQYNRTGSLRPSDSAKVTRNASYHIGVLIAAGASRTTTPHPQEGSDR